MAKKQKKEVANKISRTTIILYVIIVAVIIAIFSSMGLAQSDSGCCGGCCDCCCCSSRGCCGDYCEIPEKGSIPDPYGGTTMTIREYYCAFGTMPPFPPEGDCDPHEKQECTLQEGVCEGAEEECEMDEEWEDAGVGYWPGCTKKTYTNYSEYYETDEKTCDDMDNDCDGEEDEGCDEDKDKYCTEDMECTKGDYECKDGECTDCDDSNPTIHPGADETCDGVDNNCDRRVDEGCQCSPVGSEKPCDKTQGVCAGTKNVCTDCEEISCSAGHTSEWYGCDLSQIEGYRPTETGSYYCADTLDNDCDGKADCEDSGCMPYCAAPP